MKSYEITQGSRPIGVYYMSTEMLEESVARREAEMRTNRKIREAASRLSDTEKREEMLRKYGEFKVSLDSAKIVQEWADAFLRNLNAYNSTILSYIGAYGDYNGLTDVAILNAHGNVKKEKTRTGKPKHTWAYQNQGQYHSIQGALDQLDGEFSAIAIFSCYYPHDLSLTSRKSLILIPDRPIEIREWEGIPSIGEVVYSFYDPTIQRKKDRIITSNTIEAALKDLQEKNRIRKNQEEAKMLLEALE